MSCILLCDHRSYQHIVTPTFRFLSWCSAFLEGSDTRSRSSNFGLIFSSSHFLSAEMKKCGNSDIVMQSTFRCWPSCKILWHYKGGLTFPLWEEMKNWKFLRNLVKASNQKKVKFWEAKWQKILGKRLYEGRKWWADKPSCVEEKQIKNGGVCETPSWIVKVKLLGSHTENLLNCVN